MTRTPSIPRPPGGLTTLMRAEVEAYVDARIEQHAKRFADDTAEFIQDALRAQFAKAVEFGLYVPEGVARLLQAAQEIARAQAEAAQATGTETPADEPEAPAESPDPDPGHQSGIVLVH